MYIYIINLYTPYTTLNTHTYLYPLTHMNFIQSLNFCQSFKHVSGDDSEP